MRVNLCDECARDGKLKVAAVRITRQRISLHFCADHSGIDVMASDTMSNALDASENVNAMIKAEVAKDKANRKAVA